MTKLFFLLSGEHPTLPNSELKAILEAEGFGYEIVGELRQVIRIEAHVESVKSIVRRSALTRACNIELACCNAASKDILETVRSVPVEDFIGKGETFAVRVRKVGESSPQLEGNQLERGLGATLLRRIRGAKVHLTDPDKTFLGVLTDAKFIFGLKLAEIAPKPFVERRPRKRPFFHPSSMPAKLARCMVNLARAKVGDLVLDPFCGTASILIEAGLIDCRVVGFDVLRRMVKGSLRNLSRYDVQPVGVGIADARDLPITKVDCIATDPPYGRSATTLGCETHQLIREFLSSVDDHIGKGGRICIASPKSVNVGKLGEELAFKRVESHFVHVHRSLTREITVLERI